MYPPYSQPDFHRRCTPLYLGSSVISSARLSMTVMAGMSTSEGILANSKITSSSASDRSPRN
eukprot:44862-Eustigmatos_ZCMA.PRE.1